MIVHRIHKSGGSYAIVVPRAFLDFLNITNHDYVILKLLPGKIILEPLRHFPKPKKKKK